MLTGLFDGTLASEELASTEDSLEVESLLVLPIELELGERLKLFVLSPKALSDDDIDYWRLVSGMLSRICAGMRGSCRGLGAFFRRFGAPSAALDRQGQVLDVNQAWLDYWGISECQEAVGQSVPEDFPSLSEFSGLLRSGSLGMVAATRGTLRHPRLGLEEVVIYLTPVDESGQSDAAVVLTLFSDTVTSTSLRGDERKPVFSPREEEVMVGIAAGQTSKEIATNLGVSESTVLFHRHRIREKLDIVGGRANLRRKLLEFIGE